MAFQSRLLPAGALAVLSGIVSLPAQTGIRLTNPVLFVTQVPIPADFATIGSTFANHQGDIGAAGRGGDLYIVYTDGSLRNLTEAAGYGVKGFQDDAGIAVREPSVHWNGRKAVFSMVVGSPKQYQQQRFYWQLYEISHFGQNEKPVITKVPGQPANYNNVSPFYGTDDRILFISDRPRNGQVQLYPQLDEYELTPTTTGVWSLDPATGNLFQLNHAPSGAFSSTLDSYGRVIFTRWDHLQRDQEADGDQAGNPYFQTFNYSSEAADSVPLDTREEVFPEPRSARTDLLAGTNLNGHNMNQFFPWQMNEDGAGEETLNHVGRHELSRYFNCVFNDDPAIFEFNFSLRPNQNSISNMLQIKEDGLNHGWYFGTNAPEFGTHASGPLVKIPGAPDITADKIGVTYVTNPDNSTGLYRNPLPMSGGLLLAVHTSETRDDANEGPYNAPVSRYQFRLKSLRQDGAYWTADRPLTPGIVKTVSYYAPDYLVTYSGEMWELDPAEVRPRPRPARRTQMIQIPEVKVLSEENIDVPKLVSYLKANNLALVVSRNVTTRDRADRQQPYNLSVKNSSTRTAGNQGTAYEVAHMQLFQGDQIRGWKGGWATPRPGRRVLAQPMHDALRFNPPNPGGPKGSVQIAGDGSMAAFVPAGRALSWQLTDGLGTPVVRERYWVTFQAGEIRTCSSCHAVNSTDQANHPVPTNKPEALRQLMRYYSAMKK